MDALGARATNHGTFDASSRLILPIQARSQLLPLLKNPSFNPALACLRIYPPSVIPYIADAFLSTPEQRSCRPPDKFWTLIHSVTERGDSDDMVLKGEDREQKEGIVEVEIRRKGNRKGIERTLEGWQVRSNKEENWFEQVDACDWDQLECLRALVCRRMRPSNAASDIKEQMQGVPFELMLTASQEVARARVPLPFMAEVSTSVVGKGGAILYEADSADDIDEDDPDEDLDL
ncbi:hypothetical protein FRC03_011154 [Tulasnella sp. 419]|nr:hypothetical protein FRC03_011154 [Tulasnella sp. 419]